VARRLYAVPFHLYRGRGGRAYGVDAYMWGFLEARYRVVLLVQPVDALREEPPGEACRLPVLASVEEQLRGLEEVAGLRPPPVEAPRPSLLRRLVELVVPQRWLSLGSEEGEIRVPEEAQARGLARLLGRLEPLGAIGWAVFEDSGGALLPLAEPMRRIYSELRRRDTGYRRGEAEARTRCRG